MKKRDLAVWDKVDGPGGYNSNTISFHLYVISKNKAKKQQKKQTFKYRE